MEFEDFARNFQQRVEEKMREFEKELTKAQRSIVRTATERPRAGTPAPTGRAAGTGVGPPTSTPGLMGSGAQAAGSPAGGDSAPTNPGVPSHLRLHSRREDSAQSPPPRRRGPMRPVLRSN